MPVTLRQDLLECEREAISFLKKNSVTDPTIIRTDWTADPPYILFTQEGPQGKHYPWTAWTVGRGLARKMLRLDQGFVADY